MVMVRVKVRVKVRVGLKVRVRVRVGKAPNLGLKHVDGLEQGGRGYRQDRMGLQVGCK